MFPTLIGLDMLIMLDIVPGSDVDLLLEGQTLRAPLYLDGENQTNKEVHVRAVPKAKLREQQGIVVDLPPWSDEPATYRVEVSREHLVAIGYDGASTRVGGDAQSHHMIQAEAGVSRYNLPATD